MDYRVPVSNPPSIQMPFHLAIIAEDLRPPFDEGAKNTSHQLINSFRKLQVKVSIFSHFNNQTAENLYPLPKNKFLIGNSFSKTLRAKNPDAILYIPSSSGSLGGLIRAANLKVQSSGIPIALLNLQYRKISSSTRFIGIRKYIDIVFAQSEASAEVFRSIRLKTITLPGGVDNTTFQPSNKQEKSNLRKKHNFQDSDQIILHVGHANTDRNILILSRLAELGYKVIMICSTSTAVDENLLAKLRHSGVNVVTDYVDDIQHYYQMADCYIFPVISPTSAIDAPLSVLEAMACNIPIVTTHFGALPSMFQSRDGFYFADTEDEICSLIRIAVDHNDCRTAEMVSSYSWDTIASTILDALRKTCEK